MDKVKLIRDCMRTAQSRQKSYADNRCQELEFNVDDHVFLKVSLFKGVMTFGKRGKLSPRYIGPFEILRRYEAVAYELALPTEFAAVHPVFHVSMLRKYLPDDSYVLQSPAIEVDPRMTYVEEPIAILDRQVRKLRSKEISSVKVLWSHHGEEEATWELEDDMRRLYPQLFQKGTFSCFKNSRTNLLKGENCKTLMFMRLYMVSKIEM